MYEIYRGAREVLVWLGSSSSRLDGFFQRSLDGLGLDENGKVNGAKLGKANLNALRELVRKPYWNRIWVVQELAAAKKVFLMCGDRIMPLDTIKRLIGKDANVVIFFRYDIEYMQQKYLDDRWTRKDVGVWKLIVERYWREQTTKPFNLSKLVYTYGGMECHDPRDRLYALSGLVSYRKPSIQDRTLKIDYGISIAQLYSQTLDLFKNNANESSDLAVALDLSVFLGLEQHCTTDEKLYQVSVFQQSLGLIHLTRVEMIPNDWPYYRYDASGLIS